MKNQALSQRLITIARLLTITVCILTVAAGFLLVIKEWKPFWVDEWRIIFNLKMKSAIGLFGPLDYMQQFPRVYLVIIKWFTAATGYSYFSLRLPSFIVGSFAIIYAWRLMNKLYPEAGVYKYLFVLLFTGGFSFISYYVQIKQYTMDMLLSLVAIGQLITISRMPQERLSKHQYIFFCFLSAIIPFFSYTYPICIAPVYLIVSWQSRKIFRSDIPDKKKLLFLQWLPLSLIAGSTLLFYLLDARHVTADSGMLMFWGHLMFKDGYNWKGFLAGFFMIFSKILAPSVTAGLVGFVGIAAFITGIIVSIKKRALALQMHSDYPLVYSIVLILLMLCLFLAKKLPLGESRLNAFAVPAIAILIIFLLQLLGDAVLTKLGVHLIGLLFAIIIVSSCALAYFTIYTEENYEKKLAIYTATQQALKIAAAQELPVAVTSEVAFPYNTTRNFPYYDAIPGDWVLKTFPAYNVAKHLQVYNIDQLANAQDIFRKLPDTVQKVMADDGLKHSIMSR